MLKSRLHLLLPLVLFVVCFLQLLTPAVYICRRIEADFSCLESLEAAVSPLWPYHLRNRERNGVHEITGINLYSTSEVQKINVAFITISTLRNYYYTKRRKLYQLLIANICSANIRRKVRLILFVISFCHHQNSVNLVRNESSTERLPIKHTQWLWGRNIKTKYQLKFYVFIE